MTDKPLEQAIGREQDLGPLPAGGCFPDETLRGTRARSSPVRLDLGRHRDCPLCASASPQDCFCFQSPRCLILHVSVVLGIVGSWISGSILGMFVRVLYDGVSLESVRRVKLMAFSRVGGSCLIS